MKGVVFVLLICVCSGLRWYEWKLPAAEMTCDDTPNSLMFKDPLHVKSFNTEFFFGFRTRRRETTKLTFVAPNPNPVLVPVIEETKDPIIMKFVKGKQVWCRTDYEWSFTENSFPYALAWDDNERDNMFVAFSIDGQKWAPQADFRRFSQRGWHKTYGNGENATIPVIASISTQTGDIKKATYLPAQTAWGMTQGVCVRRMHINNNGTLTVESDAWWNPLRPDKTRFDCDPNAAPYDYHTTFTGDLEHMTWAAAYGCH